MEGTWLLVAFLFVIWILNDERVLKKQRLEERQWQRDREREKMIIERLRLESQLKVEREEDAPDE